MRFLKCGMVSAWQRQVTASNMARSRASASSVLWPCRCNSSIRFRWTATSSEFGMTLSLTSRTQTGPALPCGQQRSPLAAATRSMLCHKAASVVRGLMSKPRAPRTSVHAAPCCGIRTIFWSADQGSVRREPYRSAKKSSQGCRPRASAQPIHEPVMMPWAGVFGTCSTWDGAQNRTAWNLLDHPCARRVARAALVRETQRETWHHRYTRRCS